jgi:ADP-ribose pyrophosphatase
MPEIEQVATRVVYRNRWMTVREDAIRRADGSQGVYGVVEKTDFAIVAALQDDRLHLVGQYRYPVGRRFWELPQGSWDATVHDPLLLARTELREETGLQAGSMQHGGRLFLAYGLCTQAYDIFLATQLTQGETAREPEEQGLESRWFALSEVDAMICRGEIRDASTVAALGLLRLKGLLPPAAC